jgi:hypoxanthine-DNA glycosylase
MLYIGVQLLKKHDMRNKKYFEMACQMEKQSTKHSSAMVSPNQSLKLGLKPWVGESPYVLILGTLPSDISIKSQAYYQNKSHNSFYKIMEHLFQRSVGQSDEDFIISNHIALWDCVKKANRKGNLDANIKDDIPNDIKAFLQIHPTISTVVLNGGLAKKKFYRSFPVSDFSERIKVISLISSSNAASVKFEEKLEEWRIVKYIIDAQTRVHKD